MEEGIIFDIKEFAVHDGPGVRTTVFFKGCPLRCLWCHNPEGMSPKPQLMISEESCTHCKRCQSGCSHPECQEYSRCLHACPLGLVRLAGRRVTAAALAEELLKQSDSLTEGGITLSGGEPFMQPAFLMELLQALKPMAVIVETSGYAPAETFQKAARLCTQIYMDIKHTDREQHKRLTGVYPEPILENLRWLKEQDRPFLIRMPLIPGLNDQEDNLLRLADLLEGAKNLERVEFLPYNPYAPVKYKMLGVSYPLREIKGFGYQPQIPVEEYRKRGIQVRVLSA